MKDFHDQLAAVLTKYSEVELATMLEVSQRSIYNYQKDYAKPYPKTKRKLSEIYTREFEKSGNVAEEESPKYELSNGSLTAQALVNLTDSNKILAEANKTLADAHYLISKSNNELIAMAKGATTVDVSQQIQEDVSAKWSEILGVLAKVGSGQKRWKSEQEALAELSKYVIVPGEKV